MIKQPDFNADIVVVMSLYVDSATIIQKQSVKVEKIFQPGNKKWESRFNKRKKRKQLLISHGLEAEYLLLEFNSHLAMVNMFFAWVSCANLYSISPFMHNGLYFMFESTQWIFTRSGSIAYILFVSYQ